MLKAAKYLPWDLAGLKLVLLLLLELVLVLVLV